MAPVESGQRGTPASGNPKKPPREPRCGWYPHPHAWEGIPKIDAVAAEVAAHQPIPHPPLRRLKNRMVVPSQRVRSRDRTVTAPDPSGPHATIPATASVLSCSAALGPGKEVGDDPRDMAETAPPHADDLQESRPQSSQSSAPAIIARVPRMCVQDRFELSWRARRAHRP